MIIHPISKIQRYFGWGMIFLFLVIIDQIAKCLIFVPYRNFFFVFSLSMPDSVMYGIYFIVLVLVINYLWQTRTKLAVIENISWVLILSGAVSNIGERIVLGFVRDFIYITFYKWTGVYNLADGYILLGIAILIIKNAKIKM
jgi:lipoprotein signal peptidase